MSQLAISSKTQRNSVSCDIKQREEENMNDEPNFKILTNSFHVDGLMD